MFEQKENFILPFAVNVMLNLSIRKSRPLKYSFLYCESSEVKLCCVIVFYLSLTDLNFELKQRFNFSREFWHEYIALTLLGNAKELAYMMVLSLAVIHYVQFI